MRRLYTYVYVMLNRLFLQISRIILGINILIFIAFIITGSAFLLGFLFKIGWVVASSVYVGWHLLVSAPVIYAAETCLRLIRQNCGDWRTVGLFNFSFSWLSIFGGILYNEFHLGWFAVVVIVGIAIGSILSHSISQNSRWISLVILLLPTVVFVPGVNHINGYAFLCVPITLFSATLHGWSIRLIRQPPG